MLKLILLTSALAVLATDLPSGAAGRWAATPAACAAGPSVELTPSAAILRHGSQMRRLGALDSCLSCFGGAHEPSTIVMIKTGFEQRTPTDEATFLLDTARHTLTPDFRDNPDRNLNRTYPLQDVELKRCRN